MNTATKTKTLEANGLRITLSPALDSRIYKIVGHGKVIASSFADADSLARELRAYGIEARADGILVKC